MIDSARNRLKEDDTRTTSGANTIDLPLKKLTATLALLPIVSSTTQYRMQVSVHGHFALKRRRLSVACAKVLKCLRLIQTIQASVKRRLKNYMFLSVCRSFFVEADDCRPFSARLSAQSIRIWMMKPLAQMAWAVGTCHLSGITMPFAKADHMLERRWPTKGSKHRWWNPLLKWHGQ